MVLPAGEDPFEGERGGAERPGGGHQVARRCERGRVEVDEDAGVPRDPAGVAQQAVADVDQRGGPGAGGVRTRG